jgi:hypothetical protein
MIVTGDKSSVWGKACPSAALSTTNLTWIEPRSNPDLCVERPVAKYCTNIQFI